METTTTIKKLKGGRELHITSYIQSTWENKDQYALKLNDFTALIWISDGTKVQVSIGAFYGEYHEMLDWQMLIEQVDELIRELV